jgi:hypothetical protein
MFCLVYFALPISVFLLHSTLFEYGESTINDNKRSEIHFVGPGDASYAAIFEDNNGCVSYNRIEMTILISCGNIHLTDLDSEIKDPLVLLKEYNGEEGV